MNGNLKLGITIASVVVLASASCSKESPPVTASDDNEPIIVSAASSTTEVMETLAKEFSAAADYDVKVNAGPSNALAAQIVAGAPAHLFLSANQQWADDVEKSGQTLEQVRLLTNRLVIVVPEGNPGDVHEPTDLLGPAVEHIAVAGAKVPAGIYARQALTELDLWQQLTDAGKLARGQDVRSALSYVERGEAEAGIVYSTDAKIASGVTTVYEFDASLHDEIVYVLVLLKNGSDQPAARAFYEFLQSPKVETVYARFGFARLR